MATLENNTVRSSGSARLMRRRWLFAGLVALLALGVIALLVGPRLLAGPPRAVVGFVSFDAPVAGADVRLLDMTGRELAGATTSEVGDFSVEVSGLPADFRVGVAGGTADGALLPHDLAALVIAHDAVSDAPLLIDVHLASTIVDAYLAAHPEQTLAQAEAALLVHLGLAADVEVGRDLHRNPAFSTATYLAAAEQSLDAQIAETVAAMAAGTTASYPGPVANVVIRGCDIGARPVSCPGANLSGVVLYYDNLSGANLSGANLSGAYLSYADLSRANLSRADLSRANLSRADLSGADLSGANLSRANLYAASTDSARFCRTINPDGIEMNRDC
jgi:hypothetical protein